MLGTHHMLCKTTSRQLLSTYAGCYVSIIAEAANKGNRECEMSCIYKYEIVKEHICPVCGKRFSIRYGQHTIWQYQFEQCKRKKYVCGYACYRAYMARKNGGKYI